jgi:SAM-dependent methyltransferase
MIGIYSTSVCKDPVATVNAARQIWEDSIGTPCTDVFLSSPSCNSPVFTDQSPRQISLLGKLPRGSLKGLLLQSPVRLFRDAFSEAFVAHIIDAVEDGGVLLLPYVEERAAEITGFWSIAWLRRLLGQEKKSFPSSKYAAFVLPPKQLATCSVFSAFVADIPNLASRFLVERNHVKTATYLDECAGFLKPVDLSASGLDEAESVMPDLHQNVERFLAYTTYSVMGASYKTEALRRLSRMYMPDRTGLSVVNVGGGMGFVDIELLLTCPAIAEVINCEPIAASLPVTKFLYTAFCDALSGRYQFALTAAQDYPFDQETDIVSDFAALLYIPRQKLAETLDRAWASLRSGGVFVIHENIRRPLFETKSYYDKVFLADELDSYLSRYGDIDYFRSSDICPMNKAATKDLTVFRVVQKR